MNETKLTKEEIKDLVEKTKDLDHKQAHYSLYRTLMNGTRRELLKFIGYEIRTMSDIVEKFNISEEQLKYHLSMLEQCFCIINSKEGWKSTLAGIKFLENAKMGDF